MYPTSCILIIYLREIINLFISRLRGRKEKPNDSNFTNFRYEYFYFFFSCFVVFCAVGAVVVLFQLICIFSILFGYVNFNEYKTKEKQKLTATYTFLLTSKHCFISVLHSCQYYGWRKQRCLCSYEWFGFGKTCFSSRTCRVCMFYYS